jgi:hypothetical protein
MATTRSAFALSPRLLWGLLWAVLWIGTTSSCGYLAESLMGPAAEPAVDNRESYLEQAGGPQTTVDLGAGEEPLLARFHTVLEEKEALKRHEKELADEVNALLGKLQTEQDRSTAERRLRVGAEAETKRLRRIKDDRELKILHLQMQLANLQSSKLQLEIAGIEQQIEQLGDQAARPASPLGTGR